MSVARVTTVQKSRKDQKPCGNCGTELPAGTGYLYYYVGFRSNYKRVRCLKTECFPRPSERESSKTATILAAQESFHDQVDRIDSKEAIEEAVQEVADAVNELAEEYREAADAWENGNEQLEEKADHYESQASELEGWTWDGNDEPDFCPRHEEGRPDFVEELPDCSECDHIRDEWLEECRDAAREAVDGIETL